MRAVFALSLAFFPAVALAQAPGGPPPIPGSPMPGSPMPGSPMISAPTPSPPLMQPSPLSPQMAPQPGVSDSSALGQFPPQQGYGGCNGCSYSGDYFGSGWGANSTPIRRPAPPRRLQGQWRNGIWYY